MDDHNDRPERQRQRLHARRLRQSRHRRRACRPLLTTTYTYDAANNLATTTDSAGNVRGFTYDGLGRRLSAQDLHAPGHTPFGIWYYGYDDAGNVTSQTDPKGQNVTRTYDALNRLLTESVGGTTQITNTYDSCTNGIGYLCTASSTAAKTQNAYDILGRVTYATTTIAGTGYTIGYTYDRQGNISTLTYPNGSQVSYAYNLAGQPYRVQNKLSGGSWADIASSLTYAPQGLVTSALFGNGASTTWTLQPQRPLPPRCAANPRPGRHDDPKLRVHLRSGRQPHANRQYRKHHK